VANEGRLEVCTNGVWGSVCNSGFSTTDAYVVCRQLQYTRGGTVHQSSEFGDGYMDQFYVRCNGYVNSFSECYKYDYFLSVAQDRVSLE
jgi:deleted-in-malignant-brain-tumors protein 1